jgi:hypothetical protein
MYSDSLNADPALSALLTDLKQVRRWCNEHRFEVPPIAADYIRRNKDAILFFMDQLDSISLSGREAIYPLHRELDISIVPYGGDYTRTVVRSACHVSRGDILGEVTEDDISMLIRSLEYVKYIKCEACPHELQVTPVFLPQ